MSKEKINERIYNITVLGKFPENAYYSSKRIDACDGKTIMNSSRVSLLIIKFYAKTPNIILLFASYNSDVHSIR
jgi:hypothetical protein